MIGFLTTGKATILTTVKHSVFNESSIFFNMYLLYSISLKKVAVIGCALLFLFTIAAKHSFAASLSSASATLSTSRPSASSPLSSDAAVGVGQLSIFNNGSRYLASDSAKLIRASGGIISNSNLTVASQSAALTTVYLAGTVGTAGGAGSDVLIAPITSMHKIQFTPSTTIPSGGKIIISYPGAADNSASPSASTFAFNNLAAANVVSNPATACNSPSGVAVTSPSITCTTSGIIAAGTTVTILIGCSAQSGGSCTTQVPTLINPTKPSTAGTADIWKVGIQTQDVSSVNLDNSTVAIGIIESVTVRATIDPSLTFSIAGIGNGVALNGVNSVCTQADTTNSGIASTSTEVGLGVLSIVPASPTQQISNLAAQNLTVTTNGANGYSITATSSGHLKNAATGFFLNDSVTPIVFPSAGHFFGLHPCGLDTDVVKWNSIGDLACTTSTGGSNACKYAWPTSTGPMLIAQDNTGPVGNSVMAGNGKTLVSYGATQDVNLPPGEYQTVVTYVATPSF